MIDKKIHQIWVGHYAIPQRELVNYKRIRDEHPDYEHILWTDNNLPNIPARLRPLYDEMYSRLDYVFCADILRWIVVADYGGWYLDIDWEFITRLDSLLIDHRDGVVFGHWGAGWQHCDYTITNNVFAFKRNHPLARHMVDSMPIIHGYQNAPHSPGWTGIEVKRYLGLANEFSNEIWEYHRIMREHLHEHNLDYGDYNVFQNTVLKHHALYAWEHTRKAMFARGEIV